MRDWLLLSDKSERDFRVQRRRPRPEDVLSIVSEVTRIPIHMLTGRDKRRAIAHIRQFAMLLMREHCFRNSYEQIGLAIGGREHSTIMDGCKKAAGRVKKDPKYSAFYEAACRRLEQRECASVGGEH